MRLAREVIVCSDIILLLRSQLSSGMSVTLPMPWVTLLRRPAHSGWLQGVKLTLRRLRIGLQRPVYSRNAVLAVV